MSQHPEHRFRRQSWPYPDVELRAGNLVLTRFDPDRDTEPLFRALDDPAVWSHLPTPRPRTIEELRALLLTSIQSHNCQTWVIRLGGEVVGTSSHYHEQETPQGVEIGSTYLAPSVWGTGVNDRSKALMIDAARRAGAQWIDLRTDERNARSEAAILKLGAQPNGTWIESSLRPDGTRLISKLFRLRLDEQTD